MKAPMLKNPRNGEAYCGSYMGCSCCNAKRVRKKGKKAARRKEARLWKRERWS